MTTWQHRFEPLSDRLNAHQLLWRERAFYQRQLSWEPDHPGLMMALDQLDLTGAQALQADFQALSRWLTPWLPWAGELFELCQLPFASAPQVFVSEKLARDLPGRKRSQVEAFVGALSRTDPPLPWLDWCCGKGHLARVLSAMFEGRAVQGLEWQQTLVEAGNRLAMRDHLPVKIQHCDVMATTPLQYLAGDCHAVALHACGDLHRRLLRLTVQQRLPALSVSPCCYHLGDTQNYRPLSRLGQQHDLCLTHDDIRGAIQETVTAGTGRRRRRERLQQWRLGFDLLQRELRGVDEYQPVPAVPESMAAHDFEVFCRFAAERKQISLPSTTDFNRYEQWGEERFRQVTARDLVRNLFRRPLELWLVLDYAHFLLEHGYQVTLLQFCPRHLTPRNLLLQAQLP